MSGLEPYVPRDITPALRRAVVNADRWSPDDVRSVVKVIAGSRSGRSIDWDEDAGEGWARITDETGVVALVCSSLPLVLGLEAELRDLQRLVSGVEMVGVAFFEARNLTADRTVLFEAFPALAAHDDHGNPRFSPERFDAQLLWFLTV